VALPPLGYENNFAFVIRKEDAARFDLVRISDLRKVQSRFRLGMFGEFLERADGFPGLVDAYSLELAVPPSEMDLGLLYQALEGNQIDLAVGSTTDGLIAAKGFVVLEDDRRYFPPYDALPIARQGALARHPGLRETMDLLAGRIDAPAMRRLNSEVDGRKRDPRDVAREFVLTLPVRASPQLPRLPMSLAATSERRPECRQRLRCPVRGPERDEVLPGARVVGPSSARQRHRE
jgi:glycine betaine/choline ABC-type transport system substrate-binding protein